MTATWDPLAHPRNPAGTGRGGEFRSKLPTPKIERWVGPDWSGSFLGWDSDVLYIDDEPYTRRMAYDPVTRLPARREAFWRAFYNPDTDLFKLWFPGSYGPHHAEMHNRYRADHDLPLEEPDEFEDGINLAGFDQEVEDWRDYLTPEQKIDVAARLSRLRKWMRDAVLQKEGRMGLEYEWNPALHPRDEVGRFRTLFHISAARNRKSIETYGLIPGADMFQAYGRELPLPIAPYVAPDDGWDYNNWFFTSEQAAREATKKTWGGAQGTGLDVWRVEVPEEEVLPDRDKWPNSVMTKTRVLPSRMKRLGAGAITSLPPRSPFASARSQYLGYEHHPRAYEFDPHQPRDPRGRWTKIGARVIPPWKEIVGKKLSFAASEVTMDNLTPDEQARVRDTWTRQTGVPAAKVAVNIRDVFRSAEGTSAWDEGLTWYEDAHEFSRQRAETHDVSIETMAAVVSALSPMTEWEENKRQANFMVQAYSRDSERFRSLLPQQAAHEAREWAVERGNKWQLGAGRRNMINAARLLQGETPEEVLPQAKTRGFYNSIVDPNNDWDVVVDSHMINVAYGGMTPGPAGVLVEVSKPGSADVWGDVVTPEGAEYTARPPFSWFGSPKVRGRDVGVIPLIADAVREAAAEWNAEHPDQPLSPMQVQAITWVRWLQLHPAQEKRKAVKESQRATVAALRLAGATA